MNRIKYIFILSLISILVNANNIDSLKQLIKHEKTSYNIAVLNMEIAEELLFTNPDSARIYIKRALQLAIKEKN